DDPDILALNQRADMLADRAQGFMGNVVAVEMLVAEAAKRKMIRQAIMPKLGPRPGPDIPGQEPDGNVWLSQQLIEQARDARENTSFMGGEAMRQSSQVAAKNLRQVAGRFGDVVNAEQVANDGPVRSAAIRDLLTQGHSEIAGQRAL